MALLSLFFGVLAGADQRLPYPAAGNGDRILSFNESAPYAQLAPNTTALQWTAGGESDGHYFEKSKVGDIIRTDAVTGNKTVLVKNSQLSKEVRDYWFIADDKTILYATNSTKLWRYSYKADYYVVDVATGDKKPLDENQAGDIRYATFAPAGNTIAYVRNNDLYIQDADGTNHRITTDGGPTKFNAIPDWTTEEEVLGDVYTMFYSPDGTKIAFWSADVSEVETYVLPDYMQGQKVAPLYPEFYDLRYPKPGSKNPVMSLSLLDVETLKVDSIPLDGLWGEETILGEIAWLTDAHSKFIYRAFNRVQDAEKFVIVDTETLESKTVREREDQSGWFENNRAIQYVGRLEGACDKEFYIDLSDESGWMHIYLFAVDGDKPIQLTSGEWEVSYIANVDKLRRRAHFVAAKRHSTERHFYRVDFDTKKITPLVDDTVPGYWSAEFSSDGNYYLLSYDGPQIPFEQMYCINSTTPIRTVHSNEALYKKIQQYNLPNVTWYELDHPDGYSLNVKEILPIDFDPSKKYPVLFTPYGGPNSQSTGKYFTRLDWDQYIASDPELQFIVYTVDNRGTGMKVGSTAPH
jgi:dipeptidyl-peptidase-4